VRYKSEQPEFMYNTYVKNGSTRKVRRGYRHKFQDVAFPHRIVNKLKGAVSLLDKNFNQNTACSLKRKYMKLVFGFNTEDRLIGLILRTQL
jgi:hypothetical protein